MTELVWKPTDESSSVKATIHEAVSAAAMCWKDGVFDSEMAVWVAEGLERWLREQCYIGEHND